MGKRSDFSARFREILSYGNERRHRARRLYNINICTPRRANTHPRGGEMKSETKITLEQYLDFYEDPWRSNLLRSHLNQVPSLVLVLSFSPNFLDSPSVPHFLFPNAFFLRTSISRSIPNSSSFLLFKIIVMHGFIKLHNFPKVSASLSLFFFLFKTLIFVSVFVFFLASRFLYRNTWVPSS